MPDRPIDATTTEAWRRLGDLRDGFEPDLRAWFADDPGRASDLTFTAADLFVDLSKGLVTDDVLGALLDLAEQVGVEAGATRCSAASTSTSPRTARCCTPRCGCPRTPLWRSTARTWWRDVHEVLRRVYDFADRVRSGAWTGVTGERIRTVVNIGIGGSDLGPVMAYEALEPYRQDGLECRFISNIDPTDAATTLAGLDPASTLFIVSSKTFGTLETLTNARLCKAWLLEGLSGQDEKEAVAKHFVAVSTALDKVADFGIDPDNAFGFWDWVGGRYSMDSAIGTSLVVAIGPERFAELLAGHARHGRALPAHGAGPQRAAADGAAQRLVHQLPRRPDPRRAPLRPAAAPLPGVPPAADHGVQRQGRPLGRHAGDHRHRRGVLGRARHQRAARLLPADPPGHPADPGRLHRVRQPGAPAAGQSTERHGRARAVPGQLLRPDPRARVRQDRRRGARRGHGRGRRTGPGVPGQPADHLDHGAGADARRCWAS